MSKRTKKNREQITIVKSDYHRNGISGEPFNVKIFTWVDEDGTKKKMIGIMFKEKGQCAVLDLDLLKEEKIEFGVNSFRGDFFEPYIR